MPGFEGGQNPFYRRVPKRGFNNAAFQRDYSIVNLDSIEKLGLSEVTPEILVRSGMVHDVLDGLRVLGDGILTKPVTVKAHYFTGTAKTKIESAGGQAILMARPATPRTHK
jgi:large subunit ribosomal protein L15